MRGRKTERREGRKKWKKDGALVVEKKVLTKPSFTPIGKWMLKANRMQEFLEFLSWLSENESD